MILADFIILYRIITAKIRSITVQPDTYHEDIYIYMTAKWMTWLNKELLYLSASLYRMFPYNRHNWLLQYNCMMTVHACVRVHWNNNSIGLCVCVCVYWHLLRINEILFSWFNMMWIISFFGSNKIRHFFTMQNCRNECSYMLRIYTQLSTTLSSDMLSLFSLIRRRSQNPR